MAIGLFYCRNNPVNRCDYTGKADLDPELEEDVLAAEEEGRVEDAASIINRASRNLEGLMKNGFSEHGANRFMQRYFAKFLRIYQVCKKEWT